MVKFISVVIGVCIFLAFMSLVGNPHYIETCIGIIIAILVGGWAYIKLNALKKKFKRKS